MVTQPLCTEQTPIASGQYDREQMAWSTPMDATQIKALVEKALEDKILTLEEHGQIIDAVLSDGQISEEEEKIVQELLEQVASGEVDSQY